MSLCNHVTDPKPAVQHSNGRSRTRGGIAGVNRWGKTYYPNTSYRLRRLYHLEMSVLWWYCMLRTRKENYIAPC